MGNYDDNDWDDRDDDFGEGDRRRRRRSPGRRRRRRPPWRRPRRRCPRGTREYVVQRGDTFSSIARRFDTSVETLRRLNPRIRPRDLRPGHVICVPRRRR